MNRQTRHLSAVSGDLVNFHDVGIFVSAGFNEDDGERPFVSIDTSQMKPAFTYDEETGMRGDAAPFTARQNGDYWEVVKEWDDKTEVVACFPGDGATPRLDVKAYVKARNESWHKSVGMPIIAVHLNDGAEIYDDNGEGDTAAKLPDDLRERVERVEWLKDSECRELVHALADHFKIYYTPMGSKP